MGHMSVCKRENETCVFVFPSHCQCVSVSARVYPHRCVLMDVYNCMENYRLAGLLFLSLPCKSNITSDVHHSVWPPGFSYSVYILLSSLYPLKNKRLSAPFVQRHTESLPYTKYFILQFLVLS